MSTIAIVQARTGSTRLPGKMLLDLAGAPLIVRLLERLRRCTTLDAVVCATTTLPEDDALALAVGDGVFRGHPTDLVDRHYECAMHHHAGVIVRVPGDNPCVQPSEVDRMVEAYERGTFASNLCQVMGNGYPDGLGCEVFDASMLAEAYRLGIGEQRDRVSDYWFDYRTQQATGTAAVCTVDCPPEFARPEIVLDVNTLEEYERMRAIYEALYPANPQFGIMEILAFLEGRM